MRFGLLTGLIILIATQMLCAQDKYAFVVGVENYDPEYFRNLDFAEEDAIALADQLQSMAYDVTLMTSQQRNPQKKPTTPKKILRLLDGVLQGIDKNDSLVISISGHGIQFTDDEELKGGGKETYFVPEEGSLTDKDSLLPIVQEIVARMDNCKAERKLLLVDACRNEVLSPAGDKSGGKMQLDSVFENARVVPKGMTVLFSCSSGQKSWETKELRHSVFSNFVLEYLSGKLTEDLYTDRKADVSGLVDYVRRKTNQYVVRNISPDGQYPKLIGESEPWPIGKVGPKASFSNSVGMTMKLIPAGKFTMGSPVGEVKHYEDESQRPIELTIPYYMGSHEVTVKQFDEFVKNTNRDVSDNTYGFSTATNTTVAGDEFSYKNPGWDQKENHPAVCINWHDAMEYCRWLSQKEDRVYRLPTEAEWEYACRAGTKTTYSFGNQDISQFANIAEQKAWHSDNGPKDGFKFSSPVGTFKPNAFGLFDMHGNASEWCFDFWQKEYYKNSPIKDPKGPDSGKLRITKGGAFGNEAQLTRSATKIQTHPNDRFWSIGFRVVCEID